MEIQTLEVVMINLFRRRILLYSPSRQMTIYMLLSKFQNSKCGIAVPIQKIKQKAKNKK